MVIFHGERMPGASRTAWPASCVRSPRRRTGEVPPRCGCGAAVWRRCRARWASAR